MTPRIATSFAEGRDNIAIPEYGTATTLQPKQRIRQESRGLIVREKGLDPARFAWPRTRARPFFRLPHFRTFSAHDSVDF
jgi:hypothetical protein